MNFASLSRANADDDSNTECNSTSGQRQLRRRNNASSPVGLTKTAASTESKVSPHDTRTLPRNTRSDKNTKTDAASNVTLNRTRTTRGKPSHADSDDNVTVSRKTRSAQRQNDILGAEPDPGSKDKDHSGNEDHDENESNVDDSEGSADELDDDGDDDYEDGAGAGAGSSSKVASNSTSKGLKQKIRNKNKAKVEEEAQEISSDSGKNFAPPAIFRFKYFAKYVF